MRQRLIVGVLVVVLCFYLALVGYQGILFVGTGTPIAMALGVAVLVLPAIGCLLVWRELRFGAATARLAAELQASGRWPTEVLPTMPSGRPRRDAADDLFAVRKSEVDAKPADWGAWYRLGLAYEDAGDRRRARQALRHSIALHDG